MHIKKMITVLLVTAVVIASLTSCSSPRSEGEVISDLESAMSIGFQHLSTESGTTSDGYDKRIYYFEDENGVGFRVLSGVYKSPLGPHSGPASCDYACVLFDRQKDMVMNAVQSDLQIELVESIDRDGISIGNGIEIRVSDYSDIEKVSQLVENALMSLEPFPFQPGKDQYVCIFYLPTIKVIAANGAVIGRYDFRTEGSSQYPTIQERISELQENYLEDMRRGDIEKEELPYDVWERFPANNINTLYLNGERIFENRTYYFNEPMGGYQIRQIEIFGDDGILAQYVKQMDGNYTVEGAKKTWTVNGDIWCAISRSNAEEKKDYETLRTYYEITKNGEALKMPSEMPFEEFGEFFDFEIRIDQEEPAIYIVTPLQLEATNE